MHLLESKFNADRDLVIERARQVGINKLIEVTCEMSYWGRALELAHKKHNIFIALGTHPNNISTMQDTYSNQLQTAAKYKKCVAIGEIGLDYHYKPLHYEINKQKECFVQQLNVALNLDKPVIIHCREAYEDMLDILSKYYHHVKETNNGVIHCFSGTLEYAQAFIKLGFLLGVDGPITYNIHNQQVISQISIDKLIVETDSPYLIPHKYKHQTKRNEPCYITATIEQIAKLKNLSYNMVSQATTNNALKLFNL
jgi:TatD DNase family protein